MSVKQIGDCVQKQQMDWGAAERGRGTQPLFSLLSVCLRFLSVCMSAFLSVCQSVCLEKLTNTLLFPSCHFISSLLLCQLLRHTNSPISSLPPSPQLFFCLQFLSPFPHFTSLPLSHYFTLTFKLPFVYMCAFVLFLVLTFSTFLHQ